MSRSHPAADTWRNWSGLETARDLRVVTPTSTDAVVSEVLRAHDTGTTLKMVGTGHSFTPIARPDHTLLRPHGLTGIVGIDRAAMTVTALAGTPLKAFNTSLEGLGLSLHNMGDIAEQTLAGAVSTGTHGTGGVTASLADQVVGLRLVAGDGSVLDLSPTHDPADLDLARLGLGALGVITEVTFAVEPLFCLEATEESMSWAEALARFDELVADHHHVDMYWFPFTDRFLTKRNSRLDVGPEEAAPLPRWRARIEDDLLANTVFGWQTAALNRMPRAVPRANRFASRLLGGRTYSDVAHRVFTSARDVRFKEMEYAVPREVGLDVLREVRRVLDRSHLPVSFPIEVRVAPADGVPLSTAYRRDAMYLAFHTHHRAEHVEYFALMESIMRAHDGRPHWGKLHNRSASDFEELYPRFADFTRLRDRLDPARIFTNPHLRHILGS